MNTMRKITVSVCACRRGALSWALCVGGRSALLLSLLLGAVSVSAEEVRIEEGMAKPFEDITMMAPIRELIREMHVEEGDLIKQGDVLVSFRSEKQRLAVERHKQLVSKAEFDYQAVQRLYEAEATSLEDKLAKEVELKRLENELQIAEEELAERTLVAPFDGVVVRKFKDPGESIAENDPVIQVIMVDRLKLLFHLEAKFLPLIQIGQDIAVSFPALPEVPEALATVNFIDPVVDSRSGLFRVRLLLDNQEGLVRPGLRVRGSFPEPPARPEDS